MRPRTTGTYRTSALVLDRRRYNAKYRVRTRVRERREMSRKKSTDRTHEACEVAVRAGISPQGRFTFFELGRVETSPAAPFLRLLTLSWPVGSADAISLPWCGS